MINVRVELAPNIFLITPIENGDGDETLTLSADAAIALGDIAKHLRRLRQEIIEETSESDRRQVANTIKGVIDRIPKA